MGNAGESRHSEEWNPDESAVTTSPSRAIPSWLDWMAAAGIAIYGAFAVFTGLDLLRQHFDGGIDGPVSAGVYSATHAPIPQVTGSLFFIFGLVYMLAGTWYLHHRRRARRSGDTPAWLAGREHIVSSAGFGLFTLWTVISPIIAGGITGYLASEDSRPSVAGVYTGALCVALVVVPLLITTTPAMAVELSIVANPAVMFFLFLFMFSFLFAIIVIIVGLLAGVAGWAGGQIAS